MTAVNDRPIHVVVASPETQGSQDREDRVHLPEHANIIDLLHALRLTSSPVYEDVRRHVLRLSGDVLAFGNERPALHDLREQLARGGPILITEPNAGDSS